MPEKLRRPSLTDAVFAGISPSLIAGIIAGAASGEILVGIGAFLAVEAAMVWMLVRKLGR